jgi:hypothetical protein
MNVNPPAIRYKGDKDKSISLKSPAIQFYNFLSSQLRSQDISYINRSIVLPDGSTIDANLRKEGIYGNIFGNVLITTSSISVPSGKYRLAFALVDDYGNWEWLEDETTDTLYLGISSFSKDIIGYSPEYTGTNAASSLPFIGRKYCYGKKTAVSIAFAKYSLSDDSIYTAISGGSISGLWKNYDTQYANRTGLSLIYNKEEYIYDVQFGGHAFGGDLSLKYFGQGLAISHYLPKKIILIAGSATTDINYYIFGLSNGNTIAPGYYQNGYLINRITLLDMELHGRLEGATKSYSDAREVSLLTLPGLPILSFITSHDITHDAYMLRFTEDSQYDPGSKLIYSCAYHTVDKLFNRAFLLFSIHLSRGFHTYGLETNLTNFNMTEQDFTHFTSPPVADYYNRDKASIISPLDYTTYEPAQNIREDYVGFIKKTNTYVSNYVDKYTDNDYPNSVTENVYSIRINLATNAVTTTLLKTTTFSEVTNITGSIADPLTAGTETTYIMSGSETILDCYYADYINNVFILGKLKVTGTTPASSFYSAEYKIELYDNGSISTLDTYTISTSGYIYNRTFSEVDIDNKVAWSLWDSFRYLSTNRTGLPSPKSHYAIWYKLLNGETPVVSGVANTTTSRGDFLKNYYIETIGGVTTTTPIPTSSTLSKIQYPFLTNVYYEE